MKKLLNVALGLLLVSSVMEGQQTHVLIITGLSGAPNYVKAFNETAATLADSAKKKWGIPDSSVIVLGEDPTADPTHINGRSTREEVASAFMRLSKRAKPGDVLLVFVNGHGGGEGAGSRVNLPGPDPTAADYATWLAGFARQSVVFVNAATGSGDFVPVLKGPGRVIVTATKTAIEKNESLFAFPFVRGLVSGDADSDKDGRISVAEAFAFAQKEVARSYDESRKLQSEHAVLSDSALARRVAFGASGAGSDPRVAALVAERQALESQVQELRGRKAAMDSTAYSRELERLLLAIAEKSQAIRASAVKP